MAMLLAAGALGIAGGSLLAGWLNPGSTTNVDVAEGGTYIADENQQTDDDDDGFLGLGNLGGIMEILPLILLMKFI
jgi:hypothetical protein